MAVKKVTLNSCISTNLHKPKTSNGYTLYPKVDGYKGTSEGGEDSSKAMTDETYIKQSKANYNSPRNIKRIFITCKTVTVEYHTGPIISGKSSTRWARTAVKDPASGMSLYEIAMKIVKYDEDMHKYNMERAINKDAKIPNQYMVEGRFNFATYPYACSNVEEIYFDWSVLLSQEINKECTELTKGATPAQIINTFVNYNTHTIISNPLMINLFKSQSLGAHEDLRKRFPRLREITFISSLDQILESPNIKGYMHPVPGVDEQSGNPYQTWYEVNKETIENCNTCVVRGDLTKSVRNPSSDFTVDSSIYKFDYEVLSAYAASYKDKATQIRIDSYNKKDDKDAIDESTISMGELEKRLLELEQEETTKEGHSKGEMQQALIFAYNSCGLSKQEITKILRHFTKPNRSRIAKMLNIDL
jgi:hypothetical protein